MSLSMKEDAMDFHLYLLDEEQQRQLTTKVENIKRMCMSRVESLFVQRYHDTNDGDELYELVEECDYWKGSPCFTDAVISDLVKIGDIGKRMREVAL